MSTTATRILAENLQHANFGAIGGGFTPLGVPLFNPSVMMILTNATDENVIFSFDGINDHVFVPNGSSVTLNFSSNKVNDRGLFLANNTRVYVTQGPDGPPSSGAVWVSSFYAYPGTGS